jgi:hypothetical protein
MSSLRLKNRLFGASMRTTQINSVRNCKNWTQRYSLNQPSISSVRTASSANKKYLCLTQLIQKVFSEGINEKDSISAMALIRSSDAHFLGNVIIATELQRLYVLDSYGHSIISKRIIPFTASIVLGHGSVADKYVIVCIGREGDICLFLNKDLHEPS